MRLAKLAAVATTVVTVGAAGALLPTGVAFAAGECDANHFCAWRDDHYNGDRLISSAAAKGTKNVGVERDAVTSAKNLTNNTWVGVNIRSFGLPDQDIFRFGPQTNYENIGAGANDHIDHFDVR